MPRIDDYLNAVLQSRGSDLHFMAGDLPRVRVFGELRPLANEPLDAAFVRDTLLEILPKPALQRLESHDGADFAYTMGEAGRFRVNVLRHLNGLGAVMRAIPSKALTMAELKLPDVVRTLARSANGLILVTGKTGSGKSTTLAAIIDEINNQLKGHILTIEDPIEFSHPNLKSVVNQREVGVDTFSYSDALRSAMREAPDVILVGEIRDRETMEAALQLCNTGHLCLSTMHANNANQAMERIINLFPQNLYKQLYMDLSLNIRAVISQRLVMGLDGRRVAAMEIMINTPHIADLILKGNIGEIKAAMEQSGAKGMQSFDMALHDLYREDHISLEEALSNADSRTNLEAKINFG